MRLAMVLLMLVTAAAPLGAQTVSPPVREVNLEGPRVGLTVLSDGVLNRLRALNVDVGPVITQFGWQFEKRLYTGQGDVTVVTEWVALLGGLEQGLALPSLTWLVGLRTREGAEFGIGPNLSPAGTGLAIAGGVTFQAGGLNVPVNLAVVPSKHGARISVLTGFTLGRRR